MIPESKDALKSFGLFLVGILLVASFMGLGVGLFVRLVSVIGGL